MPKRFAINKWLRLNQCARVHWIVNDFHVRFDCALCVLFLFPSVGNITSTNRTQRNLIFAWKIFRFFVFTPFFVCMLFAETFFFFSVCWWATTKCRSYIIPFGRSHTCTLWVLVFFWAWPFLWILIDRWSFIVSSNSVLKIFFAFSCLHRRQSTNNNFQENFFVVFSLAFSFLWSRK